MYIIYKMLYNRHQCYSKFFHFKCIELFINLTHIFKISKTVTCPNTLFHRSLNMLKTDVSVHIFFKQLRRIFIYILYFKKYIIFGNAFITVFSYHLQMLIVCIYSRGHMGQCMNYFIYYLRTILSEVAYFNNFI